MAFIFPPVALGVSGAAASGIVNRCLLPEWRVSIARSHEPWGGRASMMAAAADHKEISVAAVEHTARTSLLGPEGATAAATEAESRSAVGQGAPSGVSPPLEAGVAAPPRNGATRSGSPPNTPPSREGGRGGRGGRAVRTRRPGEGRGRGGKPGASRRKAAYVRSREFVLKVRGMSRWNWRGVLKELDAYVETEAKFGEAEQGKDGASDGKVSVHAYNSCLIHLAKCSRWREALAVFERMWANGVTPNSFCLNATLGACSAAREWEQCLATLERAKASGLEVNEFSYNICIAACGAGKQWQTALGLLREIEAAGRSGKGAAGQSRLAPTVATYGATIRALGLSGKWRLSMDIFRELQGLKGAAGEGARGIVPDVVTYTTLLAALAQNGRTSEAKQVWEEMVAAGVQPDAATYHAMIAGHGHAAAAEIASAGAGASAAAAAAAAVSVPCTRPAASSDSPPPPPPGREKWAEALELFNQMPLNGVPHTSASYGTAIVAAGRCGLWEEAVALLDRMKGRGDVDASGAPELTPKAAPLAPNNYIYSAAIVACGSSGEWEQALRLLREMPEMGVQTDMLTYSAVISVLARESRLEEAWAVMREMSDSGLTPTSGSAYDGILEVYGKGPAAAEELVARVRGLAEPDFFAYSSAIAVCASVAARRAAGADAPSPNKSAASKSDGNEAASLLREMMAAGLQPDQGCFTNALSACRDRREGKEAVAILREMEAAGLTPDGVVYTLVMTACGGAGSWKEAVSLVREMEGKGVPPNFISYSVAISACAKAGQHEPVLELLAEMKDAGVTPNTVTYSSAIAACTASGQCGPAVGLLRDMSERGLAPSRTSYTLAIKACAQGDDADMVISLLREMPKAGLDPDAGCYAAALSALRDDCDKSVALLREMRELGLVSPSVLYVGAVKTCRRAGKLEEVEELTKEMTSLFGQARVSALLPE